MLPPKASTVIIIVLSSSTLSVLSHAYYTKAKESEQGDLEG